MKKFFAVVVLALTTLTMSAQHDSKFTVKAGVGLSSVVGSDAKNAKMKFSYKVGVSYDITLAKSFSIIPGIEFATKGYNSDNIKGNINMSYLQVPVFAAFKFKLSDNTKLAIKAGPYASFGLFGSDILWATGGKTNIFDKNNGFKRFDAGVIAGLSLDISHFIVGVEYSRGLTKLDPNYKQFNQAFGVVFGYNF